MTTSNETPKPAAQQGVKPPGPPVTRPVNLASMSIGEEDLADMQVLDQKSLDPNRHYRAIRADDVAIAKARRRGYEPETIKEGGVRLLVSQPTGGDGMIRMGDRILMSCPKAKHDARQRAKQKRSAERLGSVQEKTRESAKRLEEATGHKVTVITDKE